MIVLIATVLATITIGLCYIVAKLRVRAMRVPNAASGPLIIEGTATRISEDLPCGTISVKTASPLAGAGSQRTSC